MEHLRDEVMMLALRVGEVMLRSGAEVERVEGAVSTVCRTSGFPFAECFAIPTGIFVSLGQDGMRDEEINFEGIKSITGKTDHSQNLGNLGTVLKRVTSITTDFQKVSEVNALVQRYAAGKLSLHQSIAEINKIEKTAHFIWPLRIVAVMFVAAFFALMAGGAPIDIAPALISGVLAWLASMGIESLRINRFIAIFLGSFMAAGLALLCFNLGFGSSLISIITGAITMFLPGVALTNATRDLVAGDLLSGTTRIVESVLIAASIALGVGLMLEIGPAPIHADVPVDHALILQLMFAALGIIGVCVALNSPRRLIVITSVLGACGWGLYEFLVSSGEPRVLACFASACVIAILAETAVRITREPFTLFVIPAIWPLVPGSSMHNAMLQLLEGNYERAGVLGIEALLVAGGIACALLMVVSLFRVMSRLYARFVKKKGKA